MNIFFCSDIHLEFPGAEPVEVPKEADVAIFAGDIHTGMDAIRFIEQTAEANPDKDIIFVPGNHEYYNNGLHEINVLAGQILGPIENAHFLERSAVTIDGVRFLGATLWTGFDVLSDVSVPVAKTCADLIADFTLIRVHHNRLHADDVERMYQNTREWLIRELPKHDYAKTVVVTHFAPCLDVKHLVIKSDVLTPYFQANCGDLIDEYLPAYWIFGHNHYNHERLRGLTRLISNQRGYPGEHVDGYKPNRMISIDTDV